MADHSDVADILPALEQLPGVERVLVDPERRELGLILRGDADPAEVQQAADGIIGDRGYAILPLYRPGLRDRHRVRFVGIQPEQAREQRIGFTVRLEWNGAEYTGHAVGEHSMPIQIRSAATAALAAVATLLPDDVQIRLAGVKQVRAFDADLIVVSLYRPDVRPHYLVGTVVAGDDPPRAAALSVLNALNRVLGNYLNLG